MVASAAWASGARQRIAASFISLVYIHGSSKPRSRQRSARSASRAARCRWRFLAAMKGRRSPGYFNSSNRPSFNKRYLRDLHAIVFPKKPAIQNTKAIKSTTGSRIQVNLAFKTRRDIVHAAAKRITIAQTATGHQAGAASHRIIERGSGMVNNCPTYPDGRDRRVLRTHRKRCAALCRKLVEPM